MNRYIDRIRQSALNSASVVRGLRGFYRKNSENDFYENISINETVKEVVHEKGYGLFFPGAYLPEFTNETFAPSWHDVVQKDQDVFQANYARWAIVLFASAWDRQVLSWDACHTPKY